MKLIKAQKKLAQRIDVLEKCSEMMDSGIKKEKR